MSWKGKKKKILVVDGEPGIRQLIRRILIGEYIVIEAANGVEAVDITRRKMPDLVLMDLMIPGMDGLSACKAIKTFTDTRKIPVLLLTASEGSQMTANGPGAADEYINKPFEPRILLKVINRLLNNQNGVC